MLCWTFWFKTFEFSFWIVSLPVIGKQASLLLLKTSLEQVPKSFHPLHFFLHTFQFWNWKFFFCSTDSLTFWGMSPPPPPQLVDFVWWADRASVLVAPGGEWLTFVIMTVLSSGSTGFVPNTVSNSFREKYKKQKKWEKCL